jgi:hypothetical protein
MSSDFLVSTMFREVDEWKTFLRVCGNSDLENPVWCKPIVLSRACDIPLQVQAGPFKP